MGHPWPVLREMQTLRQLRLRPPELDPPLADRITRMCQFSQLCPCSHEHNLCAFPHRRQPVAKQRICEASAAGGIERSGPGRAFDNPARARSVADDITGRNGALVDRVPLDVRVTALVLPSH